MKYFLFLLLLATGSMRNPIGARSIAGGAYSYDPSRNDTLQLIIITQMNYEVCYDMN